MPPSDNGQSTSAVREGMQLDVDKLLAYLGAHMPSSAPLVEPVVVKQFEHGQSNPTYFLQDAAGNRYVLRKKPPGALLSATAHAVEREFRILNALGRHSNVPVPAVYALCEDKEVLGTPFYVMQFLEGRIFTDNLLRSVQGDRKAYYYSIIDTIAKLHKAPYKEIGLSSYGKPGNFYPRQLARLTQVSASQAAVTDSAGVPVGALYNLPASSAWFTANLPADEVSLCHGDFKLDNVVFHNHDPRVIGVLDWELSTVGHPLSDLANLLLPWYTPPGNFGADLSLMNEKRPLPVPEAEDMLKVYCEKVGRPYPIPGWNFCVAFAFFRLAVITQGVAARMKRKQASSAKAAAAASLFQPCAKRVAQIAATGSLFELITPPPEQQQGPAGAPVPKL
ncbi:kinase-like domain-containing protein [Powellomyces hirtus]|nr:kinase-like domain-containing protein [Powellomyces hirtus]